jgi:hypothetical protein
VGSHVAALREPFPTDLTLVWALSSVSAFMSLEVSWSASASSYHELAGEDIYLQVSELRKASTTSRFLAWLRQKS